MNIVFMGTSLFALPALESLYEHENVLAVYTKKDKPRNRGMKVIPGEIKAFAEEHNIPVRTPAKFNNEEINYLKHLAPDLIIVVSYGLKIPQDVLNIPKYGTINAHASLLPKYRGSSPINAAILNGEKESGVTIFFLNEDWDAGDILISEKIKIEDDETAESLWEKLRFLSAKLLIKAVQVLEKKVYKPVPQNHSDATFAYKIKKNDAEIDWSKSAQEIERMVRAYYSWPIAYTYLNGKVLKIHKADILEKDFDVSPGTVVRVNKKEGIIIACGKGALILKEIQLEGKKKIDVASFLNGYKLSEGDRIGIK